jgi:ubiquinone/menaquinone biosynthesis C-methylase UbiE
MRGAALQEPLALTADVVRLRAWRMPDMVVYQHAPSEWWLTPLDDQLPLIRLNRAGAELLAAMDGSVTVGRLLERFGDRVCGPAGETGRWHIERWPLRAFSLCYFGEAPPTSDRAGARWDLLLQRIREEWSGSREFEGEAHLSEFHLKDIPGQESHFETVETTVSHLFREPSEALQGLTYGRLLARQLRRLGWWTPKPRWILEVGGGLGYVARELAAELSADEREGVRYLSLDLTGPFLASQVRLAQEGGWSCRAVQANGEWLPLRDASIDLIIDNENLADMTPVKLTRGELASGQGRSPLHQEALDWIRRLRLPFDQDVPDEWMFNLGPLRFLAEVWRVLKPGGRAVLVEFGIEHGLPAPVKLPGHTEYEVQFTQLRQAARWLGFQERLSALPQFLVMRPDTRLLCTGAAYAIRRFCEAEGRSFAIRAYSERELAQALGDMLPKLTGYHYHEVSDPAWFGLWDFKVLTVEKPGGTPRPAFREVSGFRWYAQK